MGVCLQESILKGGSTVQAQGEKGESPTARYQNTQTLQCARRGGGGGYILWLLHDVFSFAEGIPRTIFLCVALYLLAFARHAGPLKTPEQDVAVNM